jgi:hypothetical protein
MKKITIAVTAGIALTLFTGCANKSTSGVETATAPTKISYNYTTQVPLWVYHPQVGNSLAAVGIAPKVLFKDFQETAAFEDGRRKLRDVVMNQLKALFYRIAPLTAIQGQEEAQIADKIAAYASALAVQNAKKVAEWTDPLGYLYMLVTVNKDDVKNALAVSFEKQQALWKKLFPTKHSFKEVAALLGF